MFGFKRKEKSQIPAPEPVGRNRPAGQHGGQPSDDGPPERRYNRQAPSYNPQPVAGSYGNYGNYDSGYASNTNREELFRGAKPPTGSTGAAFDSQYSRGAGQRYGGEQQGEGGYREGAEGEQQEGEEHRQEGNEEDDEV